MSRQPTDRSVEAVARAWCRERGWSHVAEGDEDYEDRRRITEIAQLLRARDAAWRRAVRKMRKPNKSWHLMPVYGQGWNDACDRLLATAPGARGTKGKRLPC